MATTELTVGPEVGVGGGAPAGAAEVGAALDGELSLDMPHTGAVLTEIGRSFLDYQVVARREAEQRRELAAIPDLTLSVPYFDDDIHSLEGLLRPGEGIWS